MLTGAVAEAGKAGKAPSPNAASTAAKPVVSKTAPVSASPCNAAGSIVQEHEQELAGCAEGIRKACAMYYAPAVPEGKAGGGQGKAKSAPTPEAAGSLMPSAEGPGAITRPALIPPNAAEMEAKCSGRLDAMRTEAQTHFQQASDRLRKQASASIPSESLMQHQHFRGMLHACNILQNIYCSESTEVSMGDV